MLYTININGLLTTGCIASVKIRSDRNAYFKRFLAIIITMYKEIGRRHNLPHFHAEYQGEEAVISFNGEVIEGNIPNKKLKLAIAWTEIHKEDLEANWKLLSEGREFFKIEPLRQELILHAATKNN